MQKTQKKCIKKKNMHKNAYLTSGLFMIHLPGL